MSDRPRVIIVGGSVGGLTAALSLLDAGCDVEVFERVPQTLEGRGAGIVMHPETVRHLVEKDPDALTGRSVSAEWFRYLSIDGKVLHEEPCRYLFTSYTAIYHPLRMMLDADRYHVGEEAVGFEQDDDGVTVTFASGRIERGDMLVCADGVNSAGRQWLIPDSKPEYSGYIAWRGTIGEERLTPESHEALRGAITYYVSPVPGNGEHMLVYPIPGPEIADGGPPLANWLWYRNMDPEERDELLVDRNGVQLVASMPPGLAQDRFVDQLRGEASDRLPPPFAELVESTEQPFVQVINDVGVDRMAFGRTCLIGDAAFGVRPHVAAGAAKAANDAKALGDAMRATGNDVLPAIEQWEVDQLALGKHVLQRTRDVGASVQFNGTWKPGDPLSFGLRERGDGQMSEATSGPGSTVK